MDFFLLNPFFNFHTPLNSKHIVNFITFFTVYRDKDIWYCLFIGALNVIRTTVNVPWSGLSKAEVERQYVQWQQGIDTDIYSFPPLLHNLLDAGLQLDPSKRNLDMNRMRRFLQTLEVRIYCTRTQNYSKFA